MKTHKDGTICSATNCPDCSMTKAPDKKLSKCCGFEAKKAKEYICWGCNQPCDILEAPDNDKEWEDWKREFYVKFGEKMPYYMSRADWDRIELFIYNLWNFTRQKSRQKTREETLEEMMGVIDWEKVEKVLDKRFSEGTQFPNALKNHGVRIEIEEVIKSDLKKKLEND